MLLDQHSRGAAGRNRPLNLARLLKEHIPIPAQDAQERIAELLEQEYSVARSVDHKVGIINEYRRRLVNDVITGKLDVREAAARLPEEALPDIAEEPIDETDDIELADEEAET
jgi:type I restriction enzyme S subunit